MKLNNCEARYRSTSFQYIKTIIVKHGIRSWTSNTSTISFVEIRQFSIFELKSVSNLTRLQLFALGYKSLYFTSTLPFFNFPC